MCSGWLYFYIPLGENDPTRQAVDPPQSRKPLQSGWGDSKPRDTDASLGFQRLNLERYCPIGNPEMLLDINPHAEVCDPWEPADFVSFALLTAGMLKYNSCVCVYRFWEDPLCGWF